MSYQALLSLSQAAVAIGLIISALGGYGVYYFDQKNGEGLIVRPKPVVDLCRRGISVSDLGESKLYFDIPYCAGKGVNAHNVKLLAGVFAKVDNGFETLYPFSDDFPDGIALSYETGKSMNFMLHPLTPSRIPSLIIAVKGTFTGESERTKYPVFDVFKFNVVNESWVRTMGAEDRAVREFILSLPGSSSA